MVERRFSRTVLAILIVLVLVAGGAVAGVLYYFNHAPGPPGPARIAVGDNVSVNYIGYFGSSPQIGRVFDTSIYSVALNNATYPKSLEFALRGNESTYTPLTFVDGSSSGLVTGFWQGVLGMAVNQTRFVTIPPGLGYGAQNTSCLVTAPLTFTVPTVVTVAASAFATTYPGESAVAGTQFADPTYGWPDLVLSANASAVVVENLPTVGWTSSPSGYPVSVTNLTATTVTLTDQLSPSQAGLVLGHATTSFTCGSAPATTDYIVSAVNVGSGTFVENFNKEVIGQTLIFQITVVSINA